jgi:hypothetical protein
MEPNQMPRLIAFVLPQFHPIPENSEWWGAGFTDWTNVAKAKPIFKGHYQPQLPADLSFYDLRVPESREDQANLAKEYGLDGFCYYHYWFKGKRLLERPVNEILASGKPDFPFCLCWANETWSRRWLGEEKEILIKQEYSDEDDLNHAEYLASVFADNRYLRVNGRPLFVIYRPSDLPNPAKTIRVIKEIVFKKNNVEPFIVGNNSHQLSSEKLLAAGCDAILNFRPQLSALPNAFNDEFTWNRWSRNFLKFGQANGKLKLYDYQEALELMQALEPETFDHIIPCVFVGWDNTARRGDKGIVVINSTAELFKQEVIRTQNKLSRATNNTGLIFINAWNEWAEGNHLEPDQ